MEMVGSISAKSGGSAQLNCRMGRVSMHIRCVPVHKKSNLYIYTYCVYIYIYIYKYIVYICTFEQVTSK
jgi:hypothetical protein